MEKDDDMREREREEWALPFKTLMLKSSQGPKTDPN